MHRMCLLLHAFLSSADFFKNQLFRKILSEIPSECEIVWTQIRSDLFVGPDLGPNCLQRLSEKDCREWKLTTVDPQVRSTWRSGVRFAMRAASQLPGKGPTDVDDASAPAY